MNENERYEEVCKPNFESQAKKLDQILSLLQDTNNTPGIITRIDRLEQKYKSISGLWGLLLKNWQIIAMILILAVTGLQGKKISADEIRHIAEQLKKLPVMVEDAQ